MVKSTLSNAQQIRFSPQKLFPFNFFSLLGIDTYTPNELADPSRCVYGRNFRLYAPNDTKNRVAITKRQGHEFYSVPVGETVDQQLNSTTGANAKAVSLVTWIGQPYTAGANGQLTKVDVNIENVGSGLGPYIVAVYSDNSGNPGTLLATSSVSSTVITGSLQYLSARFIEAPTQASGTVYWIVCLTQDGNNASYGWSSTTSATTARISSDAGNSWSATSFSMNLNTYVTPANPVKGETRYYSTAAPQTVFAAGTNVYTVNDTTGATTSISSGLNPSATSYEFTTVNDKLYYVNGQDGPQVYNGSTVSAIGGSPSASTACSIEVHTNSLFLLQPTTNLVVFSDPGNYESFGTNSFIYIPSPNTSDPCIKIVSVGGVLYCFTRNTKYLLFGTTSLTSGTTASTANLVLKESPSSKGAVAADAICKDEEAVYFMSDDFHVYSFNGTTDTKLSSERVAAILRNVASTSTIKLYINDKKLYLSYTSPGLSSSNNRLIYDLVFNEWIPDEETYSNFGVSWNSQSDTNQLVVGSSIVAALYYGDVGFNDLGKPIKFDWWSKYMSFGTPAAKHRVKRYYTFLQAETTNSFVDCQIDADELDSPVSNPVFVGGSGAEWGAATWGNFTWGETSLIRTRITVGGQAYLHQFRFVEVGADTEVHIIGFSTYVLPKQVK